MKKMVRNPLLLIILVLFFPVWSFGQTPTRWMNIKSGETVVYSIKVTDSLAIQFVVVDSGCVDIDGNSYSTVLIGAQEWTVENLRTTKYNDGTTIQNITDNTAWTTTTTGVYCAYENNASYVTTYGYLYNWHAVNSGKLAPNGWRVPTDEDWQSLEKFLGMNETDARSTGWRGNDEGGKLKEVGFSHWNSPNTGATNSSGFTALAGGMRVNYYNGAFSDLWVIGSWWSSTPYGSGSWSRGIVNSLSTIHRVSSSRGDGLSVRLVRDIN